MSQEIYWLTLTALMTGVLWLPYIANRMLERGILGAMKPDTGTQAKAAWAQRMMRAHSNAVENLVVFSTLVIALEISATNSALTATAALVYFFARLVHLVSFTLATPYLRTVAFLVGFGCQMAIGLTVLGLL